MGKAPHTPTKLPLVREYPFPLSFFSYLRSYSKLQRGGRETMWLPRKAAVAHRLKVRQIQDPIRFAVALVVRGHLHLVHFVHDSSVNQAADNLLERFERIS